MPAAEVIKDYLVRLGFETQAPVQVQKALREIEASLDKLAKNKSTVIWAKGMAVYAGAIATVIASTAGLLKKVAQTDMQYEKLALRMHMTKESAKQLTIAQKALGASIEEIAWNPEIRQQYHELRKQIASSSPPSKEFGAQMQMIRSIIFEVTKMKTLMISATEWISYHLAKMFKNDLKKLKKWFKTSNEWLRKNLPIWTKWIANFIGGVAILAKGFVTIGKGVFDVLKSIFNILPDGAAAFIALGTAIAIAFMKNPVLATIGALLLLLQDFFIWKWGKDNNKEVKVAFGDLWQTVDNTFSHIKPAMIDLQNVFKDLLSMPGKYTKDWSLWKSILDSVVLLVEALGLGVTTIVRTVEWGFARAKLRSEYEETAKTVGIGLHGQKGSEAYEKEKAKRLNAPGVGMFDRRKVVEDLNRELMGGDWDERFDNLDNNYFNHMYKAVDGTIIGKTFKASSEANNILSQAMADAKAQQAFNERPYKKQSPINIPNYMHRADYTQKVFDPNNVLSQSINGGSTNFFINRMDVNANNPSQFGSAMKDQTRRGYEGVK